jgi:hypothetical protein
MRLDILHLVCSLWSENWDDTIILTAASVLSTFFNLWIFVYYSRKILLVGNELKSMKVHLTVEKVGRSKVCGLFYQICIYFNFTWSMCLTVGFFRYLFLLLLLITFR